MNSNHAYHPFAKFLHWLMAAIWIFVWFAGALAVHARETLNPHHELTDWHKRLAITLVFLIVVRVAWRLVKPAPALPQSMSPLMQRAALAGHAALYLLALIAMPLSGWMLSSLAGKPIELLGLIPIPPLTAPDKSLLGLARSAHVYLAWTCGAMVLGHALFAFKHHFVDKDSVLLSMLPRKKS